MNEYNVKKRVFGNGLVELRLMKEAVKIGYATKNKNVKSENIDVPFENDKIRMSKFLDGQGYQRAIEPQDKERALRVSLKRTVDKIYDYANSNNWKWFCTFTFSQDNVERTDYEQISKKFTQWLNNMRKRYCADMKYLVVPERHKDGSWHFHGLFSDCDGLKFMEAINNQEFYKGKKNKFYLEPLKRKGEQVYNIKNFKLGFTECTKVKDTKKVSNYILKYVTKDIIKDIPNKRRYWASRNLELPEETLYNVPFREYTEFCKDVATEISLHDNNIYTNSCVLEYGDFKQEITYIKFDGAVGNIEFDGELFKEIKKILDE